MCVHCTHFPMSSRNPLLVCFRRMEKQPFKCSVTKLAYCYQVPYSPINQGYMCPLTSSHTHTSHHLTYPSHLTSSHISFTPHIISHILHIISHTLTSSHTPHIISHTPHIISHTPHIISHPHIILHTPHIIISHSFPNITFPL